MIRVVRWSRESLDDWYRFSDYAINRMPKEYGESVIGVLHASRATIYALWPVRHTAGRLHVDFDPDAVALHKRQARVLGMEWLGFLHSHPGDSTPYLSAGDHECGCDFAAPLIGSCHITGKLMHTVHEPYWMEPSRIRIEHES